MTVLWFTEMFQGTSVSWRLGRTGVYLGPPRLICYVEYRTVTKTGGYLCEHVRERSVQIPTRCCGACDCPSSHSLCNISSLHPTVSLPGGPVCIYLLAS